LSISAKVFGLKAVVKHLRKSRNSFSDFWRICATTIGLKNHIARLMQLGVFVIIALGDGGNLEKGGKRLNVQGISDIFLRNLNDDCHMK